MRKILKGTGASVLAAATVVTGLSFGPAALAAPAAEPSATASTSSVPADGTEFKLVVKERSDKFWGQASPSYVHMKAYTTQAQAQAQSSTLRTTSVGTSFYATFTDGPLAGQCISDFGVSAHLLKTLDDCGAARTLFHLDGTGQMVSTDSGVHVISTPRLYQGSHYLELASQGTGATFEGLSTSADDPEDLPVKVDSTDWASRSATISGTTVPLSHIIVDGGEKIDVEANGSWKATVGELERGTNQLHIENWVGERLHAQHDLTVELEIGGIVAFSEATAGATNGVRIYGLAAVGADVSITDAKGAKLATTAADGPQGEFSAVVPTPGTAGRHVYTVAQSINGTEFGSTTVDFIADENAGTPAPTANATLEPNVSSKALLTGTGMKGALVTIKNGTTTLESPTVQANGKWATRINPIGAGSHTLTVTQTVDGTESTPATTTVDYGKALSVTSPIDDQIVTGLTTFTGTGAAGSEIVVRAGNRVPVCKVTMVTAGAWSCTDTNNILPMGKYNVLVEQVAKGGLITTAMASMEKLPVGYRAPSVTTPGTVDSVRPTITGNATPNATIRVKNAAGTTIIDTRADRAGAWSKVPSTALTTGENKLTVTQIVNPGGHTDVVSHALTVAR